MTVTGDPLKQNCAAEAAAAAESIPQQVPPREASDSLACESQRQSKENGNERKTERGTVGKEIHLYLCAGKINLHCTVAVF